jgi:hypothetical protein
VYCVYSLDQESITPFMVSAINLFVMISWRSYYETDCSCSSLSCKLLMFIILSFTYYYSFFACYLPFAICPISFWFSFDNYSIEASLSLNYAANLSFSNSKKANFDAVFPFYWEALACKSWTWTFNWAIYLLACCNCSLMSW